MIIDKNSEAGLVVITERGYTVQQVNTGQDVYVDQYTELTLREGQACRIDGSSTVLYYKTRSTPLLSRRPLPSQAPSQQSGRKQVEDGPLPPPPRRAVPEGIPTGAAMGLTSERSPTPDSLPSIRMRLQKDAEGHFTRPHDFSVLDGIAGMRSFFSWFAKQTGRGGDDGPSRLAITLKDAMPVAKTFEVWVGDGSVENFQRLKKDISVEFENTRAFMPDLVEFGVLVVDPEWK